MSVGHSVEHIILDLLVVFEAEFLSLLDLISNHLVKPPSPDRGRVGVGEPVLHPFRADSVVARADEAAGRVDQVRQLVSIHKAQPGVLLLPALLGEAAMGDFVLPVREDNAWSVANVPVRSGKDEVDRPEAQPLEVGSQFVAV